MRLLTARAPGSGPVADVQRVPGGSCNMMIAATPARVYVLERGNVWWRTSAGFSAEGATLAAHIGRILRCQPPPRPLEVQEIATHELGLEGVGEHALKLAEPVLGDE